MDPILAKVDVLFQQGNYKEAERSLSGLLSNDPENSYLLFLMGEVKLQLNKLDEAKELAERVIHIDPGYGVGYYLKSRVMLNYGEVEQAELLASTAIQHDPEDADYHAWMAMIRLQQREFKEALETAEHALTLDPGHILALNARSTALIKLGRAQESFSSAEDALREDPNNAYTHATYGWNLLERGDHRKAKEHFRESLRIDPSTELGREGMVEAIKATNPLYRLFLRYAFWMSRLSGQQRWFVILGVYFGIRILRAIASSNESLRPFLIPLVAVLMILVLGTWVIGPLSNLVLRLNKYGKYLLNRQETIVSNLVGISCAVFVLSLPFAFITGNDLFLMLAAFGFTMMLPLGNIYVDDKLSKLYVGYAIGMALVGCGAIVTRLTTGEPFSMFTVIYIIAFVAFQWVANIVKK